MPNKRNDKRRHHNPKMKFRIRNWPEFEAGLRARGSLTMWVTDDEFANWEAAPRLTPGGRSRYPDLAIETGLMLGSAFHLALRQTEGLMSSVFGLLGVPLGIPDHTTLSRRGMNLKSVSIGCPLPTGQLEVLIDSTGLKVFGAGGWLQEKHGAKARRTWRKLHLAVSIDPRRRTRWRGDAITGMIVASTLTGKDTGDPSQVAPLLDLVEGEIVRVTADGAYDGAPTYEAVVARAGEIPVIIPPHKDAIPSPPVETNPSQRGPYIALIESKGQLGWQKETGYGRRSLVETTMGRFKSIIGPQLRARGPGGQKREAAIGVSVLNRMLNAGRPDSPRPDSIRRSKVVA